MILGDGRAEGSAPRFPLKTNQIRGKKRRDFKAGPRLRKEDLAQADVDRGDSPGAVQSSVVADYWVCAYNR